jgi:hypothetical protein
MGARAGALGVSSAIERKELPDRRRAASLVDLVKAERPWFMCSGNLKSMETVLANCAIAITAYKKLVTANKEGSIEYRKGIQTLTKALVSSQNFLRSAMSFRSRTNWTLPRSRFVTSAVDTA